MSRIPDGWLNPCDATWDLVVSGDLVATIMHDSHGWVGTYYGDDKPAWMVHTHSHDRRKAMELVLDYVTAPEVKP